MNRRLLSAAACAAVGLCSLLLPAGPADASDASVRLPLGAVSDVLADPAHGLVFVSGRYNSFIDDGWSGGVVVANADGTNAHLLVSGLDVNGLALGPDGRVYAAEAAGTIVAIDPVQGAVAASYQTTGADCPDSLAAVGTQLWFSYGCTPGSSAALGVLDPGTGTVTTGILAGARPARAILAAVPGHTDELVATDVTAAAATSVLTVTGTAATVSSTVAGTATDLAVAPDGNSVVLTDGSFAREYPLPGLGSPATTYPTPRDGADSVAYAPDGHYLAVSVGRPGDPDTITTFGPDGASPVRTYDTSTPGSAGRAQTTIPAAHGMAWSGHTLLAVYADYGQGYPTLKVLSGATQAVTAVSVSGPSTVARGAVVQLGGRLTSGAAGLASIRLSVVRTDLAGAHPLAAAVTDGSGRFTVRDTPSVGGPNTYTIAYAGDTTTAPVSFRYALSVSRATTALSVATNRRGYAFGDRAAVTVHLGPTYNGRTVALYAQPTGAPRRLVRSGTVDRHGNLTAYYRVTTRTVFSAGYAGDYRYAPRTVSTSSAVAARLTTRLGPSSGHRGAYQLFPSAKGAPVGGVVAPNKSGECLRFVLQREDGGFWHEVAEGCFGMDSRSLSIGIAKGSPGHAYRTRAEYRGDRANTGAVGRWYYVEFI